MQRRLIREKAFLDIILKLAKSNQGRGDVAASVLLGAFMVEIARSDGLMTSLEIGKSHIEAFDKRGRLCTAGCSWWPQCTC